MLLENSYANKTVPNQTASWETICKQNSSQSECFLRTHMQTKQFQMRLNLEKSYINKTVPNQTASWEIICKQNSSQSDCFLRSYTNKTVPIRLLLEKSYADKTVSNQTASWEIMCKQNCSQSDCFLRNHMKTKLFLIRLRHENQMQTKPFPIWLLLEKSYANKTVPNQTASWEIICKQNSSTSDCFLRNHM